MRVIVDSEATHSYNLGPIIFKEAFMSEFNGFSKELVTFFKNLKKNNSKEWFDKHRKDYDTYVIGPAREFVVAMGDKLRGIAPSVNAIPKVNASLQDK